MSKKYILYGVGRQGMLAFRKYGKERVALFCDGFSEAKEIDGIPVVRPDALSDILKEHPDYTVVITPKIDKVQEEIGKALKARGISYLIFEKTDSKAYGTKTFRICGEGTDPKYLVDQEMIKGYNWRVEPTIDMFRAMFSLFSKEFEGKQIDLTIFVGDHVLDAYKQCMESGLERIFAYSTVYPLAKYVIPLPDHRCFFDAEKYPFQETPEKCRIAGETVWADTRIGWRGTIASDDERQWLQILSEQYPGILYVEDPLWEKNNVYIPMTELAKYKYTLDIRGYGYTDRVKVLLQLGRPLFLVDRPFQEWFFDKLVPMENYVLIKEDMSDLVEKYEYLEANPEAYQKIVNNMNKLYDECFAPKAILTYLKETVLKYGVVDR